MSTLLQNCFCVGFFKVCQFLFYYGHVIHVDDNDDDCHGLCSVMFFPKNNYRTAPMMATSPLFSTTFTTSHPHQTYIGPPSEFFPYSNTTNNLHSYHCHYQPAPCAIYYGTTRAPPCSTHVPCLRPITPRTHQFLRSHQRHFPRHVKSTCLEFT